MRSILQKTGLLIVMLSAFLCARAYDIEVDGIYYNINTYSKVVSVTAGDEKYSGIVNIPASVVFKDQSLPVTSISSNAFEGCNDLTGITIPNSITDIGESAFKGCNGLVSVSIPNSITDIRESTFSGCSGLVSVSIPNSVTKIGKWTFYKCKGLTSITIPESVTRIESYLFMYCTGLTSFTIPNSVTEIGESAFVGCSGLTSITIPNSVTEIGSDAFENCTGLTSITIPDLITGIWASTFEGCTGLIDITIPNSVTRIGNNAFKGCKGLTSITIPNSVTIIGRYAFEGCTGLTGITIPYSVTEIGSRAFKDCPLEKVVFENDGNKDIDFLKLEYDFKSYKDDPPFYGNYLVKDAILGRRFIIFYKGIYGSEDLPFPPESWKGSLQNLTISSNDVLETKKFTLSGFNNLKRLTFKENVNQFQLSTLNECETLEEIYVENPTPPSVSNFSKQVYLNATLYVPDEAIEAYKKSLVWGNFFDIRGITAGIDDIVVDGPEKEVVIYDLMGRRLLQPQKGLNIINGKKVMVK